MVVPVILSGGSGTRLWPVSRTQHPKQLHPLVEERSMVRATIDRVLALADASDPIVVCSAAHRDIVASELRAAGCTPRLILEPFGRNTAPAVAFAALASDPEDVLIVVPADHLIPDSASFASATTEAVALARQQRLVTFGVIPTHPETGYGYIRTGDRLTGTAYELQEFVEKPDLKTANDYVDSGKYLWNSGMFALCSDVYLDQLARHAPKIALAVNETWASTRHEADGSIVLDATAFEKCPSKSIDYAVMEHTTRGAVVPLDAGWSDIGSWNAVWEVTAKDSLGTAAVGDVRVTDVRNSYVRSDGPLVAVAGVSDIVIVATDDAVLVVPRAQPQRMTDILNDLQNLDRDELTVHRVTEHLWGSMRQLTADGSVVMMTINAGSTVHEDATPLGTYVIQSGEVTISESTYTPGDTYAMMTAHAVKAHAGLPARIVVTHTEGHS